MKKTSVLAFTLFSFTVIFFLVIFFYCINTNNKQTEIIQVGSAIVLSENKQHKHSVEGLEGEFINGIYINRDYTYSPTGDEYRILDQKGSCVATAYLAKKEEVFTNNVEIDLNSYGDVGYVVPKDVDSVYITGYNGKYSGEFCLVIEDREAPLDILLHNVEIFNNGTIGVIYNYSRQAVNIMCSGDVYLSAGYAPSYLTEKESFADNYYTALNTWTYSLLMSGINPIGNSIYQSVKNNDASYIVDYSNFLIEQSQKTVDDFYNVFFGSNGGNGLDSTATIISEGPIYIHSDGTANIVGGSGGSGGDAGGGGLLMNSSGGKGGAASSAIVAPVIVNDCYNSDKLTIEAGVPGRGGRGEYNGDDGSDGRKAADYECNLYFWR